MKNGYSLQRPVIIVDGGENGLDKLLALMEVLETVACRCYKRGQISDEINLKVQQLMEEIRTLIHESYSIT